MQAFDLEQMMDKLKECDQFELIRNIQNSNQDVTKIQLLYKQLTQIDDFYDGGLKSYMMKVS